MNSPAAAHSMQEETAEQRRYHRVREIFDEASVLIAPFFARESRWANSTLDHLAYRVVRDRYPELSAAEVHVLVVACARLYADT
ncbi:MAG: hypothetical protein CVU19_08180 [Betaproteobacteria bacterium HGW-Betaproteobacteria-13]|jgi:hypothetical protein|uniref:Uncharacterized protein n=2 Tax=Parazoarcus communis TaxID=41977 RepID=A0A2U8H3B0_9RHOO|nr:hypothetical protein CEW87_12420 [Parazoarcus communis]PKO59418.1 MAG: hypothetical protein CVU25_02180 [Betaproteobacteria bacterium HGW-Betaproteobacteria-19]PKO81246.1 MAG: hypothetical protein CVU19_08180 [Betaproteobacteria bacterium HGW-Betaproteobacteria-13]